MEYQDPPRPLREHIRELRYRIWMILVSITAGFTLAYVLRTEILRWLLAPMAKAVADEPQLHFTNPVEPFFTYLKLSLKAGLVFAVPGIFYNVWAFVAPALYRRERALLMGTSAAAALLFAGGVAFGYYAVFPYGFKFLMGYAYQGGAMSTMTPAISTALHRAFGFDIHTGPLVVIRPTIMMGEYLKLMTNLLLSFGVVFELPIIILFAAKIGLTTPRGLMKFFKYFIVLSFIVAAILTPPDVITQVMMAIPLVIMYLLSMALAWLVARNES